MAGKNIQSRPRLGADASAVQEANDAVAGLVAALQAGWDQYDADITDRHLAADVIWGSPYGATLDGFEQLHAIHVKLKRQNKGGASSRFEVQRVLVPMRGVAVAHIKRVALTPNGQPLEPNSDMNGPFSEMALYVLIHRDDNWWLAAAQNTPIRPGGAV